MIGRVGPHYEDVAGLIWDVYEYGRIEDPDPRIVAAWRSLAELEPPLRANGRPDVQQLAELMEAPIAALGDRAPAKPVWHCVIRAHPDDRTLTDDEWAQIASDVMDRTGLSPAGQQDNAARWVAIRHGDDHIHIVATLARQDGGKARLSFEYYRVADACRAAEERYGLQPARREAMTRRPDPGSAAAERGDIRAKAARKTGEPYLGYGGHPYQEYLVTMADGTERRTTVPVSDGVRAPQTAKRNAEGAGPWRHPSQPSYRQTHRTAEAPVANASAPGHEPPSPHESARAYLRRTPHEFVAYQGRRPLGEPTGCACGLRPSDAIHVGGELLGTRDYLGRVTAALNELVMNTDSDLDDPLICRPQPAAAKLRAVKVAGPAAREARGQDLQGLMSRRRYQVRRQSGQCRLQHSARGQPGPTRPTSNSPVSPPRPGLR